MPPPGRNPSFSPDGVLANLPPGPWHSEPDIDIDEAALSSDDASVQALDEAPDHLRRRSNRDHPIPVDSDDDGEEGGEVDAGRNVVRDDEPAVHGMMDELEAEARLAEDEFGGLYPDEDYGDLEDDDLHFGPLHRRPHRAFQVLVPSDEEDKLDDDVDWGADDDLGGDEGEHAGPALDEFAEDQLIPGDDDDPFDFLDQVPHPVIPRRPRNYDSDGEDNAWGASDDSDVGDVGGQPEVDYQAPRRKRRRVGFAIPNMLDRIREPPAVGPSGQDRYLLDGLTDNDGAGPSKSKSPSPGAEELLLEVVAILPDIDPTWALAYLEAELADGRVKELSNTVIDRALEMEGGYPKVAPLAKDEEEAVNEGYEGMRYRKSKRLGREYLRLGREALELAFPKVPAPFIRSTFVAHAFLYGPTYFRLVEHAERDHKSYMELKRPRTGKNKAMDHEASNSQNGGPSGSRDGVGTNDHGAAEFHLERAWVEQHEATQRAKTAEDLAKKAAREETLAAGQGVECGCCFGEEVCSDMIQCADGHLFCPECVVKHAETKLGEEQTSIVCMDMSGCQSPFLIAELSRALAPKSIELYHRLKQSKELEEAAIDGLETCPNCPYAAVIDNPDEKLFHCLNDGCKKVTCRKCRFPAHIPKSCEEMEADRKLDQRHAVEDAMSDALIRKCPKCAKPFIKESGCNKITCQGCRTISCYICRKAIPEGYAHFDQQPGAYGQPRQGGKCCLWDGTEAQQDHDNIIAARDAAQQAARRLAVEQGVELADADLEVAMPARPAGPLGPNGAVMAGPAGAAVRGVAHMPLAGDVPGIPQDFFDLRARVQAARVALDIPPRPVPPQVGIQAPAPFVYRDHPIHPADPLFHALPLPPDYIPPLDARARPAPRAVPPLPARARRPHGLPPVMPEPVADVLARVNPRNPPAAPVPPMPVNRRGKRPRPGVRLEVGPQIPRGAAAQRRQQDEDAERLRREALVRLREERQQRLQLAQLQRERRMLDAELGRDGRRAARALEL